jgi:hypothetical protein
MIPIVKQKVNSRYQKICLLSPPFAASRGENQLIFATRERTRPPQIAT